MPIQKREKMKVHETKELFRIIEDDEKNQIFIAVGNNVVSSKNFKSVQAAYDYIKQKPYELIFNTMYCLMLNYLENENFKEGEPSIKENTSDTEKN